MRVDYLKSIAKEIKTAALLAVFFSMTILTGAVAQELQGLDREISRIVDQVSATVVTVEAHQRESKTPLYSGSARALDEPIYAVVGSGLLIDSIGHILTVLGAVDGYEDFRAEIDGRIVEADLVGMDRSHNVAVLKVPGVFPQWAEVSTIPPFSGRLALAYGRVIGRTGYPALGIIAGRQSDGTYLMSGSVLPGLLGGGVFDLSGKLLGLISSGSITATGPRDRYWGGIIILPVSTAIAAADRIICCGNREAGYLGIKTTDIELVMSDENVLHEAVVISDVEKRSPAAAAGLRVGDIITRVAFRMITNDRELQRLISSAGADSTIPIEFIRGQIRLNVNVPLAATPQRRNAVNGSAEATTGNRDYVTAMELRKRIDSLQVETSRLQRELDQLMDRLDSAR